MEDSADSAAAIPPATTPGTIRAENWPRVTSPVEYSEDIERRVDRLLAEMTLAQKVGQIIQADIDYVTPDDVRRYHLGSVLNGGSSAPGDKPYAPAGEWLALADAFYDASVEAAGDDEPIPVIWGSDAVHGHANVTGATVFPHNIGLGAMRNPDLMREIGRVTALEMRVTGIGWTFAPTLAVARDDRWGRTYESYSENTDLVSEYARAMLEGLQGEIGDESFLWGSNVLATAKHFVADGGTAGGRDQGDARISEEEIVRVHVTPYVAAIETGAQVVMASFSSWQGEKVHGSRDLLTTALKERMGFNGFIVGDWNAHGQIPGCTTGSCPAAINAGLDMFMAPDNWRELHENTLRQVEAGEIPIERLDDAVHRILRVKMLAGVFDAGRPSSWPAAGNTGLLASPEHRAIARQAVRESLVLLKNGGNVLPLDPGATVLVAGDGADNLAKQTGGWTLTWQGSNVPREDYVNAESIYEGIAAKVGAAGGRVEYRPDGRFERRPDVAIVVFGEDPYAEYQGDRSHVAFVEDKGEHRSIMRRLRAESVPVVAVFLSGRPMWVNPEINAADAFVAAWLPGSEGGGVADVLFGEHEFTGRLSFSWPRSGSQVVNVGDPDYDPLFAYGYGLSTSEPGEIPQLPEDSSLADLGSDADRTLFTNGMFRKPWALTIGDASGRRADATLAAAESGSIQARVVDGRAQEDSRRLVWSGAASAAVSRPDAVDWTHESDAALAIEIDWRVAAVPSAAVTLSMRCGAGCAAGIDVTDALRAASAGPFVRTAIPLQCFAERGVDMARVDSGFVLETEGRLDVTIVSVALGSSPEGRIAC